MTNIALANYENEQAPFTEFFASDAEPNILLFQGESGSGKSYLIEQSLKQTPDNLSFHMKLDREGEPLPRLWTRMGSKLGWERLPHFTQRVADLLDQSAQAANPEWQVQMLEHLQEIGRLPDMDSRLSRQGARISCG